ncbi:MAG: 5-oxoprolinase subunit PxpA [bacterium]|nr:5-oxoprolinase subunit PxpA [bacterium]
MASIDLNCDLGESFGNYKIGNDELVIPVVSSCNIACGMHAGDPVVMGRTVDMAIAAGISIGAHPGYPDLQGFGRRNMDIAPDDMYDYTLYQVGALMAHCKAKGARLAHVKPHGQFYNTAAVDMPLAEAIASAVHDLDPTLVLVGLSGGCLIEAGKKAGLKVANEFFADRNYCDDGTLAPRSMPKATIAGESYAVERLIKVIEEGKLISITGREIEVACDTVCVHGDNARALQFAQKIRNTLTANGINIAPVA